METSANEDYRPVASRLYLVIRLVVGCLLMVAGTAKFTAGQPMLLASQWVVPAVFIVSWGFIEFALGWIVLSFVAYQPLRRGLVVLFGFFASLLLVEWFRGATQCQCLGGSGLPILGMIGLDAAIFAALIWQRSWWDRPSLMPIGILGDVATWTKVVVPMLLLLATVIYGSPRAAIQYLSGSSILLDPVDRFAGIIAPKEVTTAVYELRNNSRTSIRVMGAKATCRCVAIDDLPLTLGPGEVGTIRVRLIGSPVAGVQRESAQLIFDGSATRLTLGVTALVHLNP